jgi:N-acetylglucosamine-6-phosphate deacetylase
MLGMADTKGTLAPGADADLVIFTEEEGGRKLKLDEVWKFGSRVSRSD